MITNINVSIQKDSSGHEPDISSGEVKRIAGRNFNHCIESRSPNNSILMVLRLSLHHVNKIDYFSVKRMFGTLKLRNHEKGL